ncbi:hypothetical protein BHM03_00054571 [Ensete ventricosum]|uniref:Uncharacterized protein n=1 Tax=Ensete ventricosum TaxID=4639 RepID=A0A445MM64_ENSVE|nr:hypothetical protein BHM03_00054571 [Ensete ventricosum]
MLQTDHRLPLGVGPRERRAPLPVCGTVHLTGLRNYRSSSIPSHPGILGRTETIEVLLVTDRAIARNATRDAATDASIHGRRDVGGRQAGRVKAPPGGATPRTPPTATVEEGGQVGQEFHDLQYQIEDLIRRGHLRRYVHDQSSLPDSRPPRDSSPQPKGPVEKQIDVIFGGPTSGGDSSSARKAYARSEIGKRLTHDEDLNITFK